MLSNLVRSTRSLSLSFLGAGLLAASLPLHATPAPTTATPLITQRVDNSDRVVLHGNVHPFATPANDRGAADPSLQAPRMQLLLKRPADREAALKQYIVDIHNKNSASYHKWLKPEQIAQQYGLADSDVQAVVAWMQSQGLTVNKLSRTNSVIEFAGSVGQIQTAFHTQIHKYAVNGETHFANSVDPQIPSALAPAVNGVVRLNDFRPKSQAKVMGKATYSPVTHKAKALWNYPEDGGTLFLVDPADFAVQYDTTPLINAGTTGKGETIGIINESNIDLTLVTAFRSLFGLPASTPQVIIDGTDPGFIPGSPSSVEAYLDVEWSGAVAPAATINLYIAADTTLDDGLDFALIRAVDDDAAQILSLSFGVCEYQAGTTGNAFIESLWEQAAAQGQTVMVSTGDNGSEGCYNDGQSPFYDGLAVNGFASTPYNVAVGGTDFYYSDYAQAANANGLPPSFSNYWSNLSTDTVTPSTSISQYIPEQPWNGSQYGFNIAAYFPGTNPETFYEGETPVGGGGGASTCSNQDDAANGAVTCLGGYAKPAFQSTVTPSDSVRDIPDISLFASNGYNYSATPICGQPGDCGTDGQSPVAGNGTTITALGGTSVSAPSFAGIMALVDQVNGPQGQADYVLYPLFQQYPAVFHDVTAGSNNEPCDPTVSDLTNCVEGSDGNFSAGDYSAGTGYDLASGLGTIDANLLVTDWSKVTLTSSSTSLALSAPSITHGASETLTATVTGATTGDVAFITPSPVPSNKGVLFQNVNSSGVAALTTNTLPGGTYPITAQYSGNGTAASSTSATQQITVNPEGSTTYLAAQQTGLTLDQSSGSLVEGTYPVTNGSTYTYGTQFAVDVQPVGTSVTQSSGATVGSLNTDGIATGKVTFTDTGNAGSASIALNSEGVAEWSTGNFGVGSHSISAAYSGDPSFNASSSATPITFTVSKGTAYLDVQPSVSSQQSGSNLTVQVVVFYTGTGAAPTGSVTVQLGSLSQTASLYPFYSGGNYSAATLVFTNIPAVSSFTVSYSGDGNWNAISPETGGFSSASGGLATSTTTLTATPSGNITDATTLTLTATVAGSSTGPAPTGSVVFYSNSTEFAQVTLPAGGAGSPVTATLTIPGFNAYGGPNQFVAAYSGDGGYAGSSSAATITSVDQSDFTLAAQNQVVAIGASSSGSATVNLGSINGFNNLVNLTCSSPSSNITCSINPASVTVNLNGPVTAAVTINVGSGTTAKNETKPFWFAGGAAALACVLFFGIPARRRSWRALLSLLLFAVLLTGNGCGGGGGGTTPVQTQTATPTFSPAAGTYTSTQSVTISDTTAGATIYYTTDGSTPTTSSTKYTTAISVSSSETINAIAVASGDTASSVASADYKISSTPVTSPTGTNPTVHNVTIQVVTPSGTSTVVVTGTVPPAS